MKAVKATVRASKRLLAAIGALLASVILCIGACLAWFVNNDEVRGNGLGGDVTEGDILEFRVTAYYLDKEGNVTGSVYVKSPNGNVTDAFGNIYEVDFNSDGELNEVGGNDAMRPYTTAENDYVTAILFEISYELKLSDKTYRIYASCPGGAVDVDEILSGGGGLSDKAFKSDLSNSVYLTEPNVVGDTYTYVKNTGVAFVNRGAGYVKPDTDIIFYRGITPTQEAAGEGNATLRETKYLVMDYDSELFSYLTSQMIEKNGSLASRLFFDGDITIGIEPYDPDAEDDNVAVTGVTISKTSTTLTAGQTERLAVSVSPHDATNKRVTWSSDNESVATVSSSGLITAVSAGTAHITATTVDGGYTATCTVTVEAGAEYPVPATGAVYDAAASISGNDYIVVSADNALEYSNSTKAPAVTLTLADNSTHAVAAGKALKLNSHPEIDFTTTVPMTAHIYLSNSAQTTNTVKVNGRAYTAEEKNGYYELTLPLATAGAYEITFNNSAGNITEAAVYYIELVPGIPVHEHTYATAWSTDSFYHWHAATCEHTTLYSDRAAHSWNAGTVTTPATATTDGVMTYTCTVCAKTKTEAIPATGYTITFNYSGHGAATTAQTSGAGTLASLPEPIAAGYTFDGWYQNSSFTGSPVTTSTVFSANATLYAKWTEVVNEYTITFNANGHGTAPAARSTTNGKLATVPTITASGFVFGGWYLDEECTGSAITTSTEFTEDTTLYAKWTAAPCTVTFNSNGGSSVASQTVNNGAKATQPTAPTRSGYTFLGWFIGDTASAYDFSYAVTSDLTLKAHWISSSAAVHTYSHSNLGDVFSETSVSTSGGGVKLAQASVITVTLNVTVGEKVTIVATGSGSNTSDLSKRSGLNIDSITPAGALTFTGDDGNRCYFDLIDGTTPYDNAGTTIVEFTSAVNGTVTVNVKRGGATDTTITSLVVYGGTAPVAATEYTVTFNANGHGTAPSAQTVTEGGTATQPSALTATGYTFGGWYTTSACTTAFNFSTAITADTTVYAKWTPVTYTITYVLDGGTNSASNPASYTIETPTITLADPTKSGYTFDGWYSGSTQVTQIALGSTGDKTLTAHWTAASLTYTEDGTYNFSSVNDMFVRNGASVSGSTISFGSNTNKFEIHLVLPAGKQVTVTATGKSTSNNNANVVAVTATNATPASGTFLSVPADKSEATDSITLTASANGEVVISLGRTNGSGMSITALSVQVGEGGGTGGGGGGAQTVDFTGGGAVPSWASFTGASPSSSYYQISGSGSTLTVTTTSDDMQLVIVYTAGSSDRAPSFTYDGNPYNISNAKTVTVDLDTAGSHVLTFNGKGRIASMTLQPKP